MNPQVAHSRNEYIVSEVLKGRSQTEIGQEVGLTQGSISKILKDDDYRAILQAGIKQQILLIPKAHNVISRLLDDEDSKVKLSAAKVIFHNTGVAPSHTQSVFINNLTLNQQINVDTGVRQDIARVLQVNDVEVMDIEE
jgi:hypothetical protein